ncbi:MAG: cytidylate kinase-like family protein [Bacteroidaceae bacterium]
MKTRIITISREYGSGGIEIAKKVAAKLQLQFYDKALVAEIAKQTGFDRNFIEENGEYSPARSKYFFNLSQTEMASTGTLSIYDQIYIFQHNIITELAEKGDCVIVGRCADYILKDRKDCLHIFIHSAIAQRAKRITEEYKIVCDHPEEWLKEKDEKRQLYYKNYTDRIWGVCNNYHLTLASDKLGIENCVDTIVNLYRSIG